MPDAIDFNGETFLLIDDAFKYLVDRKSVRELENIYIYYKGFATEVIKVPANLPEHPNAFHRVEKDRIYLECFAIMEKDIREKLWGYIHTTRMLHVNSLIFQNGKINGEIPNKSLDGYYRLDDIHLIDETNVYAKQSELDYLSDQYAIPKNPSFKTNDLSPNDKDVSKTQFLDTLEDRDKEDKDETRIKDFIKNVINIYPNADSNDFISHCFACYSGNNRALEPIRKIISDLGIKHGGSGRRSNDKIKYMQPAPKYLP